MADARDDRLRRVVERAIERHSFCTLATASAGHPPHVTGVLYAPVDHAIYVSVLHSSIKARNIRESSRAAVCIPVRRIPFAPPFCVQFQGRAELLAIDEPAVATLIERGRLKKITSHGELEHPEACFARITPGRRVATYGLGVPLRELMRDPLAGSRSVELA
jgi:nitroimidazol reductase NimA-like FMN-containing flavoprotein (pyridoxamine 5'-phosphate oxidase superfamily)